MRTCRWLFPWIVLGIAIPTHAAWADATATLRQADRALNLGDAEEAETLYRRAFDEAQQEGNERLLTEIVNSLCGIDVIRGDLDKLYGHRVWANERKAKETPAPRRPDDANLIVNGGFEDGFTTPWGTGHYERKEPRFGTWWNSSDPQGKPTHACMKIDRDVRHSGEASLRIVNFTSAGHNLFTTTAQRIEGLEPHSVFRLSLFAKADNLSRGAVKFTVDAGWEVVPMVLPAETYDWKEFTAYFSNGFNDVVDLRVIHQNVGTVRLDDIRIEKIRFDEIPDDPGGQALRARVLFGSGDHRAALLILDRTIAANAGDLGARFLRGQIHLEGGLYDAAIADLMPLAEQGNGEAQMYVGDALAGLGRHIEAADWYEKSYSALKNNQLKVAQIKGRLARIYLTLARAETDTRRRDRLFQFAEQYLADNRLVSAHVGDGASLLDVSHLRGSRALQSGNLPEALAAFREGFSAYETRGRQLARLAARRRALILGRYGPFLDDYLRTLHRASLSSPTEANDHALAREAFPVAQYRYMTEANMALAQMASRRSAGNDALARLLRKRQDLANLLKSTEQRLTNAIAKDDAREVDLRDLLKRQVRKIAADLETVERELTTKYRDYDQLANPEPLTIDAVQGFLDPAEALVFLDAGAGLSWIVTKTGIRWLRIPLDRDRLATEVAALRCGLDDSTWRRDKAARCSELLGGRAAPARHEPLPFDLARAHAFYVALFGEAEDLIRDKSLLIIPTGPLSEIPLQVLVTETPSAPIPGDASDYSKAQWLMRRNALTVLPSVSSLEALRRLAEPSKATRPFIGFGNPLLLGRSGTDRRAFEHQGCEGSTEQLAAADRGIDGGAAEAPEDIFAMFERGVGNVAALRLQPPLPETAAELCTVARTVGAEGRDVRLGASATEQEIKALSGAGMLSSYAIVHFATHGLVAGETERFARTLAEPALLLTPPEIASSEDDGLLTASEVAELRLDADWVVLSACNTASAGMTDNAEALSGLARAFFYAGSRALLVSHWYVDSHAAVRLTTSTFAAIREEPQLGRAEALRRAMLSAMADATRPANWTPSAHPAVWAPFVIVGEGGRRP